MVQEDYHSDNPYHNAVHAADVTQAMYCYLREPMVTNYFDTFWLEGLCVILKLASCVRSCLSFLNSNKKSFSVFYTFGYK